LRKEFNAEFTEGAEAEGKICGDAEKEEKDNAETQRTLR
jgi:hypothetical protein